MLSLFLFHFLFGFSNLFSLSLTSPTPKSHDLAGRSPLVRRSSRLLQDDVESICQFRKRSTVSDLLACYPSIAVGDLFISAPPPSTRYRLFLTSYNYYPANSAAVAFSSFYGAIASQSSFNGGQNLKSDMAMAFGAGRLWINFYGKGDKPLVWKDLEWLGVKCRGWAEKGLVGTWNGVLWPPGQRVGISVEVKIIA